MSRQRRHNAPDTELNSPGETRIARHEDDGGRAFRNFPAQYIVPSGSDDYGAPDLVRNGVAFAMIPIMAACSAATRTSDPMRVGFAFSAAACGATLDMLALTSGRLQNDRAEWSARNAGDGQKGLCDEPDAHSRGSGRVPARRRGPEPRTGYRGDASCRADHRSHH